MDHFINFDYNDYASLTVLLTHEISKILHNFYHAAHELYLDLVKYSNFHSLLSQNSCRFVKLHFLITVIHASFSYSKWSWPENGEWKLCIDIFSEKTVSEKSFIYQASFAAIFFYSWRLLSSSTRFERISLKINTIHK